MLPSAVAAAVLLLLVLLTVASLSAAPIGLDPFLTNQIRLDPHATNDSFLSLSSHSLSSLSSLSLSPSPLSLLSLSLSVPVHVVLVGPDFPPSSSSLLLSSFLSLPLSTSHFHVISPSLSLSLSHSLSLSSSLSPPSLSKTLSDSLSETISKTPSPLRSPLLTVPHARIDEIISQHHRREKPRREFFVYVLNLGPQSKPYAYTYGPGSGESSPGFTRCSGSIYAGKDRYLWVDLGAGPVDYGPAISGEGVLPRGESHPISALHGRPKSQKALLSDIASLVYSAYQVLLVPPLRISVPFENSLIVQFIHVYDPDNKDLKGLDFKSVEKTFMDEADDNGLLLAGQTLEFKNYEIEFRKCSICSFAVDKAITTYTSRYLFDNYTLIVSEYLDSKRLHQILYESAEELRRVGNVPEEEIGRVLPVYVFDLNVNSILLLDRYHQSVAFKDMVVAVRTRSSQTVSDYSCNGRHVFTQTRELERPLVGSILQSMWGVSPTHLLWSSKHNTTLIDYTWSIGQTPFGPFSEISSLSFVQKDAARRNLILTSLNYSITSMIDVLKSLEGHGGDRKVLKPSRYTEFIQRWSFFKYKVDKAITSLSHMEFDQALYFVRSSDHDLYAIHSIVYEASQELEASLACFKDPPFPWGSALMSGGILCGIFYAYLKKDRLFSNKRKQF